MLKRRLGTVSLIIVAAMGIGVTAFWLTGSLQSRTLAAQNPIRMVLGVSEIAALTSANLAIRWHFMLRRFGFRMETKASLAVWVSSIPAIATPFYFGELIRALILARRYPRALCTIPMIWVAERLADLCILFLVLFWVRAHWVIIAGLTVLIAMGILVIRMIPHVDVIRTVTNPLELSVILLSTAAVWSMPIFALWLLLGQFGVRISPAQVADGFCVGTVLGALSGVQFGVGVTGTVMILSLEVKGVAAGIAAIVIFLFTAGTVWYAVGLGLATLLLGGNRLAAFLAPG